MQTGQHFPSFRKLVLSQRSASRASTRSVGRQPNRFSRCRRQASRRAAPTLTITRPTGPLRLPRPARALRLTKLSKVCPLRESKLIIGRLAFGGERQVRPRPIPNAVLRVGRRGEPASRGHALIGLAAAQAMPPGHLVAFPARRSRAAPVVNRRGSPEWNGEPIAPHFTDFRPPPGVWLADVHCEALATREPRHRPTRTQYVRPRPRCERTAG